MLEIQEYVDIKKHCTLRVGGTFRYFCKITSFDDLKEAHVFAKENNMRLFIIGSGSNLVFSDGVLDILACKMDIRGFEIVDEDNGSVVIKIGAGEDWDSIVERCVAHGYSGLEALSAIPGTVGATPVQNVGAYGCEIKDILVSVEAYDTKEEKMKILSNQDCHFRYRDSIFKNEEKDRYVILFVNLKLSKNPPILPDYPGVKKYFENQNEIRARQGLTREGGGIYSLKEIREAIINIRKEKLPDPKIIANVGSFFKNPIIEKNIADNLKLQYSDMPVFSLDENNVKVPAGWLIDQCGLKGRDFGPISVYDKNALVLVNKNNASYMDVKSTRDEIIEIVKNKFGIILENEPEFIF